MANLVSIKDSCQKSHNFVIQDVSTCQNYTKILILLKFLINPEEIKKVVQKNTISNRGSEYVLTH